MSSFNTLRRFNKLNRLLNTNVRFFSSPTPPSTLYRALFYDYVENILEKRAPHREGHLQHAQNYINNKNCELVLGGAFADNNVDGALIIFRTTNDKLVEEFANNDPYVINKLVTNYKIRPWTAVVGSKYQS